MVIVDDMRFDTLGAADGSEVATPNLDRLCDRGCQFTHHHNMGSTTGGVCAPARAMLYSGRSLFHLEPPGGMGGIQTLPELADEAGYQTWATGKWHNRQVAFEKCFESGTNVFWGGMHDDHWRVPVTSAGTEEGFPEPTPADNIHSSELFADSAVQFIEERADDDQPFFAAMATMAPHDPRDCPDEYHAMYDPVDIEVPENFAPEHPFDNGQLHIRDEELAAFPRDPDEVRQHIADYYAMITHLDAQLGRVFDALDETDQRENTYVVFTADHGLAVGQHGLMGKQNLYEHSTRVPLVVSGPDIPEGERRDPLSVHYDIYPTVADLLDLDAPDSVEGESLLPVVQNESETVREDLFLAYENNAGPWWEDAWLDFRESRPDAVQRALRGQRFKLIEYDIEGQRHSQLFDLESDPQETTNLADDPAYTDTLDDLRDRLAEAQDTANDPLGPIV